MTGYEYARRKRSYERNVGWCRIWLGIGIAIASLSFTFVFERNIQPLLEPRATAVERPDEKSPIADAGKNQPTVPTNRSNVAYGFLSAALILTSGVCIVIARYFRALYIKDDMELEKLEKDMSAEATQ